MILFLAALLIGAALALLTWTPQGHAIRTRVTTPASIEDRLRQYGPAARARFAPFVERAGLRYPPARLTLLAIKQHRQLHVYAGDGDGAMHWVRDYPVLAASGALGPKLREGDRQVPEGLYRIELLNPNSRFHLSLRIDYPNAFDRVQAAREGRTQLGGDIMIHGGAASIGCLAIGDEAIEELFTLVADTGLNNVSVILAPVDFRHERMPPSPTLPNWTPRLYRDIEEALRRLP